MTSTKYVIAEDSPVKRAKVDDVKIRLGDEPTGLTKGQATRLEESGVKLDPSVGVYQEPETVTIPDSNEGSDA